MDIKDIATIVSVITAVISVIFAIYSNRKSIFINTITSARIKYLENFRILIADFCSNAISENKSTLEHKNFEKIFRLNFLIKLHLDKNHQFDKNIIEKIDIITDQLSNGKSDKIFEEINSLIELAQGLSLLEWRGIKNEAMKGILGEKEKRNLIKNHLNY